MNLLILGMHRSGTSVLGRIITRLGFYPGPEDQLMEPLDENPTGFWERRDVRNINDKILAFNNSSWDCPYEAFPFSRELPEELSHSISSIVSKMESRYPYFIKDPRFSLTALHWFNKYTNFFPILAIRNPFEVALSLNKRNSFPIELGLAIWEVYTISALNILNNDNYFLYDYNTLITDPKDTISRLLVILKKFNIRVNEVSIDDLVSLVDLSLKRNQNKKSDDRRIGYYQDLYEKIVDGKSTKLSNRKLSKKSSDVLKFYRSIKDIKYETNLINKLGKAESKIIDLEKQCREKDKSLQKYSDQNTQNADRLEQLNGEALVLKSRNDQLNQKVSVFEETIVTNAKIIEELKSKNQLLHNEQKKLNDDLLLLRSQVITLKLLNEQFYKIDSQHRASITEYERNNLALKDENSRLNDLKKQLEESATSYAKKSRQLQNQILLDQIEIKLVKAGFTDSENVENLLTLHDCEKFKEEMLSAFNKSYNNFETFKSFFESIIASFFESRMVADKLNKKLESISDENERLKSSLVQADTDAQRVSENFKEKTDQIESLERHLESALNKLNREHAEVLKLKDKFHNGRLIHLYYFGRNIFRPNKS